jgi:hypothetical protein
MSHRLLCLHLGLILALAIPHQSSAGTYEIPIEISQTHHIMVRVKVDGRGPFMLLLDTGAPTLVLSTHAGGGARKESWRTFDRFEIEGGPTLRNVRGLVSDTHQLIGMNQLHLAGVELSGMLGYEILARYRIDLDVSKPTMRWTELSTPPPSPLGLVGLAETSDVLGAIMRLALLFFTPSPVPAPAPLRGRLGLEFGEESLTVKAVLAGSAAHRAGVRAGDRVLALGGQKVKTLAALQRLASAVAPGKAIALKLSRAHSEVSLTLHATGGL